MKEKELSPEGKLMNAIFGGKSKEEIEKMLKKYNIK